MTKVKVPARIIYQMKLQIESLEKVIKRKQERLKELKDSFAQMEADK